MEFNRNYIIFIDGNIGSGKSTLIDLIKQSNKTTFNIIILKEPLELWQNIKNDIDQSLFYLYYADKKRWAYSFQQFVLTTKTRMLTETINGLGGNNIIIVERSFLSDSEVFTKMCYHNKSIDTMEYNMYLYTYNYLVNELLTTLIKEHGIKCGIFYLHTDPQICKERVIKRSRDEEKKIDYSYLFEIEKLNEDLFGNTKNTKNTIKKATRRVDGNCDVEDNININVPLFFDFVKNL